MKIDILAVGVHPDDVELGCGGTLAKEIENGKKIGILDLTLGELGTRGSAEIRKKEAARAAEILGVVFRHNLEFSDGFIVNNAASQLEIIKIIRKYRPEIVICNAIEDRHPDHAKASKLTSDACFLSGLPKLETLYEGNNQNAWRPRHVYHYIQWKNIEPDVVVDITGFLEKKLEAVFAFKSQFHNEDTEEPETPISSVNFKDSITYRAQDLGRLTGVKYAEGFTASRYIAVDSLFDLI